MPKVYLLVGVLTWFGVFSQVSLAEVVLPPQTTIVALPPSCPATPPPAVAAAQKAFVQTVTPLYGQMMVQLAAGTVNTDIMQAILNQYQILFNANNAYYLLCQNAAYDYCNDLSMALAWNGINYLNYQEILYSPNVSKFQIAQAVLTWGANLLRIQNDKNIIASKNMQCNNNAGNRD